MQLAMLQPQASGIEPREYQRLAVEATFTNWDKRPSSSQIIVAPTGSGKTVMIGMVAERYLQAAQGRVLCLAHRPELVEQNYLTFRSMFPSLSCGIYAAKLGRRDQRAKVTFALVQSVARNIDAFKNCGLIVIDECHLVPHSDDGQYRAVINGIREHRGREFVKILGASASPWRLNSGNLLEPYKDQPPLFDELAYEIDMLDLLEEGHLCKVVAKSTKTRMDTTGVHKRGGEFIDAELDSKFNVDAINRAIAKETVTAALEQDRKSILIFAINISHATRLRDMVREQGISCEMVCGETPMQERRRIIGDFKKFKIRCLTSVDVLSVGFDHKGVDLVSLARPTMSPGLFLQQAGRALRTYPGKKDALLLDFAGCVARHGLLTNVKGVFKNRKADDEDEGPKARECPECGTLNEPGTKKCVGCLYEWPIFERGNAEEKLSKQNLAERVMDDAVWAPVLSATFKHNEPAGRPATLQLFYHVDHPATQQASEVWCFDHPPDSWAAKKARADWFKRTGLTPPASVIEAARRMEELRRPRFVRVVQSDCGKYWNVKGTKI